MTQLPTPILIIIISSAIAIVWAEISPFMPWLKRYLAQKKIWYKANYSTTGPRFTRRMKPFDCYECLSFWTALIVSYKRFHYTLPESIAMACVCCIFSIFVWKVVLKNNPNGQ